MTAGAKLAREGKKVLVIEQHSKPCGCTTAFKRGSYTLEVGLHEINGSSPSGMKPACIKYTNTYVYNFQPSLRARRSQTCAVPFRPAVNYAGIFDNLHFASAFIAVILFS
ncbi:MAG: FAD/NAD(P)-binding protein [Bacteroidales bacterium]